MATQKNFGTFKNLIDVMLYFNDKATCEKHLAQMRWEGGQPVCPHCGSCGKIYTMKHNYKCSDCRKQFSVTKGTIFESSHISLQKWFAALWLITSHKKGISSLQLHRDIGVTQKTAWFMLQRIRFMVRTDNFRKPLENEVEVDETYIGGKNKNRHADKKVPMSQGRSVKDKTPVFGLVERNGIVVAMKVDNTSGKNLKPIIMKHVSKAASLFTDEWRAYKGLDKDFNHSVVRHGEGEYVVGNAHTNTIEGFWSLLKRGIVGIYHSVSAKHLDLYLDEFEFRYNTREIACADRFCLSLTKSNCRLTYAELIS